jgi:hypothetical protein
MIISPGYFVNILDFGAVFWRIVLEGFLELFRASNSGS